MNILVAGLAKSGTTMLFSRIRERMDDPGLRCYFEPHTDEEIAGILDGDPGSDSLTKVLVGRVTSSTRRISEFDRNILIYRDPRDQFISMLLYLFYDFQVSGDQQGYDSCYRALEEKVNNPDDISCLALWDKISATVGRAPHVVFNNLHREQRAYADHFAPLIARYESLLAGEWDTLSDYLAMALGGDASAVPSDLQRVARSKGYGEWRHWLTDEDLATINREWQDNLQWLDYPAASERSGEAIDRNTSLTYVSQFDPSRSPE